MKRKGRKKGGDSRACVFVEKRTAKDLAVCVICHFLSCPVLSCPVLSCPDRPILS